MIFCPTTAGRRFRGLLLAAGLTMTVAPGTVVPASAADDRLALTMIAFVYSLDASPDWSAEMRRWSVDEARATITIGSLVVAAERGGLVVDIEEARLTGYAASGDGGFTADTLEVGSGTVSIAGTEIALNGMRFTDIAVPDLAALAYDRAKPFTSLIGAYSAIAKSRSTGGRIAEIGIRGTNRGKTSLITYRNVVFGALAGGKLANVSAGPLTMQSPERDPLAELRVDRAEAQGVDLDAFLDVYDPLRYIAGIGDEKWRPATDRASYTDLTLDLPGVRMTIGAITTEGLKVRQPARSFAPLIDMMTSARTPTAAAMKRARSTYLGELLSAFGVARFAIDDVVIAAAGIDQLTLGAFELTDASSDGLGEIAVEDFVAAITGQGAVQVGRFALGGVVMPPFDVFDEAFEQAEGGGDVDVSSLAPRLDSVEAEAIHMQAIDFPRLALGKLTAELGNHIGTLPTSVAAEIDDLNLATAVLPSDRLRSLVAGLGYDRIGVDARLGLSWREADGTVRLDDLELDIADFGNTTADLVLAGLTREAIERGDAVLNDLQLERARLTFEDNSVVERSLSMRAELLNIPLERLKQQLAGALPLMLAVLGERAGAMIPVLQDFIKTPGTLTIEATPEAPVPIAEIESAVRTRPQSLPSLLSINLSGEPGGEAEDRRTNAPETTGEPEAGPAAGPGAPGPAEDATVTPE